LLIFALHNLHPFLEAFFNAIIVPLMIYEVIPKNSCSAVSIASFLVYFSTYVIILQESIGILFENLFKLRQLYLQPQSCAFSNLRLAS